ncbi:MAG: CBS domain-containing protein [Anaerolineae bacterium]|nr:CBS domain-containing protein [Anaerolineae bacterium]
MFIYNVFLGLFNLLPAFPMDGGRVLRALLATAMPYTRATSIAAAIGRVTALFLGLVGFSGGGLFLIFIAFFVYIGAGHEERLTQLRAVLRGMRVEHAYSRNVAHFSPETTLREAVAAVLSGLQSTFPVCENERLVGLVTYPVLLKALDKNNPEDRLRKFMLTDIPRLQPTDDLFEAQQRMDSGASQPMDALPVVLGPNFLGLLTRRDISEVFRLRTVEPTLLIRNV